MAEIWAAALGAAVSVGTTAWQNNEAKKAQREAAQVAADNRLPAFRMPVVPDFVPLNFSNLDKAAVAADEAAFARSDADFAKRNRPVLLAEKIFKDRVLADQKGESELPPALQAEMMRAGLVSGIEAFGDTEASLAPNSAGEAAVARNMGLGIMAFQDRNRANRERSLTLAEQLFPRREIGLNGGDAAAVAAANVGSENSQRQAQFDAKVAERLKNYEIGAANARAAVTEANSLAAGRAKMAESSAKAVSNAASTIIPAIFASGGQSSMSQLAKPVAGTTMTGATGYLAGYSSNGAPIIKRA